MRVIHSAAGLPADPMLRWGARDLMNGARAWSSDDGRAFVTGAPALSLRDRLVVHGPGDSLVPLMREVLAEVGPSYRPLGERPAIAAIAAGVPELRWVADFGWMELTPPGTSTEPGTRIPAPAPDGGKPVWLGAADEPEIAALLAVAAPSSYASPGDPDVERWAGLRDDSGRLIAVAAFAWSAPTVGFLSGIAVHPELRGRGLGRVISGFAVDEAVSRYGAAALMVDDDNPGAIALYRRLGLRYRPVSAAAADEGPDRRAGSDGDPGESAAPSAAG